MVTNVLAHPPSEFATPGWVWSLQFVDHGRALVSSDCNGSIRKWDTASWRELPFPEIRFGHLTGFYRVSPLISPDEGHLLVSDENGNVNVWNLTTSKLLQTAPLHKWDIYKMHFSPDGKLLASAADGIKLLHWPGLGHAGDLNVHTLANNGMAFSRDGQRIASAGNGREGVKVSDVATLQELVCFPGDTEFFWPMFSPDEKILAAFKHPNQLYLWRAPSMEEIRSQERRTER